MILTYYLAPPTLYRPDPAIHTRRDCYNLGRARNVVVRSTPGGYQVCQACRRATGAMPAPPPPRPTLNALYLSDEPILIASLPEPMGWR